MEFVLHIGGVLEGDDVVFIVSYGNGVVVTSVEDIGAIIGVDKRSIVSAETPCDARQA